MIKSVVQNGVAINIIEWDEGSDWPVPEGCTLDDPDKFPYDPTPLLEEQSLANKQIGDMTIDEFKAAQALPAKMLSSKS